VAIKACGIVGVGLMGGSLGLALRERGIAVAALDENATSLEIALARGAADRGSAEPSILAGADLVVICTPPSTIVGAAARVLPHLKPGCLLSDFGSVKAPVVQGIEALITSTTRFVGLHPMCGTAGQGIEAARKDLFAGAVLIATPTPRTDASALDEIAELANLLGMRLIRLTPEEHDRQIALLSHAPYLFSVALTRLAPGFDCAGPAFRDATRVAMSPPMLWEQILSLNRSQVRAAVEQICQELARLAVLQDGPLEDALEKARQLRSSWEAVPPLATVSLDPVSDFKGKVRS
jgi:prephenate dehydrogenase